MTYLAEVFRENIKKSKVWAANNILGILIFNIILMFEILLYSAGYFAPYFPITINMIVFSSIILAIILFGLKSREIIFISIFFWIFTAFLNILGVNVWAERTAIYSYQALLIATSISIINLLISRK